MKQLSFNESQRLLRRYRIKLADSELTETPTHAVQTARRMSYPVVMKVDSPNIVHKTDAGVVKINLNSSTEVFNAYNELERKALRITNKINGMIVQKQHVGTEIIIGAKRDPQFGPVVLFGLGGIFVEVMKDASMRVAPFTRKEAMEMIKEIKGYPMLTGIRGGEKVNFEKLINFLLRVSTMMIENEEIIEMDLNPCFVDKNECIAADVRIMV